MDGVRYEQADREIVEKILGQLNSEQDAPISRLMVRTGMLLAGTPYVTHTLESGKEQLVINLRELDCTTYAENCLAISRTLKSGSLTFNQFIVELRHIRYRDGNLGDYPSRLHYFCDWIENNHKKKVILDISGEVARTPLRKEINFMSTHPESYRQLNGNPQLTAEIAKQEKGISAREMFYIPTVKLREVEHLLQEGDIVGITTSIEGLAVTHVGILVLKGDRIHLMHASSASEKVVVSENTLLDYLRKRKSATGIMVARPLEY